MSLFFLNETTGWMVTEVAIWSTQDAGETWKRMRSGRGYQRVFFADPLHGWLLGRKRLFEQTSDGATTQIAATCDAASADLQVLDPTTGKSLQQSSYLANFPISLSRAMQQLFRSSSMDRIPAQLLLS